jgi:hypothetical protein
MDHMLMLRNEERRTSLDLSARVRLERFELYQLLAMFLTGGRSAMR